jgi:catechol 2,3-dioxygenase-like lactoylglutathione lyase family enzyme
MTLTIGFNHAAVITPDLDRLVAFYTEVFEAQVLFRESTPALRHAILRIGEHDMLHPVERPQIAERGHLDHVGFNVGSREALEEVRRRLVARGASDGVIQDLGPQINLSFRDPDGMQAEVCWIRDPALQGFHAPVPIQEDAPVA